MGHITEEAFIKALDKEKMYELHTELKNMTKVERPSKVGKCRYESHEVNKAFPTAEKYSHSFLCSKNFIQNLNPKFVSSLKQGNRSRSNAVLPFERLSRSPTTEDCVIMLD